LCVMFNVMDGTRANCWKCGLNFSAIKGMCFSNHNIFWTQSQVFWD
jgi:hypothetical protein